MSWTPAKDISQYQGDWKDTGEPIVMIKAGGGDNGLYFDPKCTEDYNGAVNDGRAPGLYWFFGGNPTPEAAFFCKGLQPYSVGDVPAIDVERGNWDPIADPNAPQKVNQFIDYVEAQGFAGGLVYMNLATLQAHNWSVPLSRWGLWLADWAVSPDANIPTSATYVMQQYNDGPNYDHDAWFGTVEEFKAYGYRKPQPIQVSTPVPQPAPTPTQEPVPAPVQSPSTPAEVTPTPTQSTDTQPTVTPIPVQLPVSPETPVAVKRPQPVVSPVEVSKWEAFIAWLRNFLKEFINA